MKLYLPENTKRLRILSFLILLIFGFYWNQAEGQSTNPAPYCLPTSVGCGAAEIGTIILNTLNHNQACSGIDYTYWNNGGANTTTLAPGTTYSLSISAGILGAYSGDIISIWIDYDHNNVFDTYEWFQPTSFLNVTSSVTEPFTIPSTALLGLTRMRVRSRGTGNINGAGDACTSFGSGNNKDFDVTIGYPTSNTSVPPLAGFAYNILTDTAWLNSPDILVNTSNNYLHSFWDITGYSPTYGGPYTPYSASRVCAARWNTCYMDTINNNFTYTFPQVGYYRVKLKVTNLILSGTTLIEGMDSITRIVYCASPTSKPIASFFSVFRTVGFSDQLYYYDLSLNGPTQWSWWLNPGFYGVNTFLNSGVPNAFVSPTSQNPYLFALDGGVFDVCLAVGNSIGWDTICRNGYLTVNNGYVMCNGSDSVSTLSSGYVYDGGGPTGNYTHVSTGNCAAGFRIAACADTVILDVERFKLLPGDSVTIRVGNPTGAIVKRLGGSNLADSLKHFRVPGSFVFLQMSTTNTSTSGDSGFAIHWSIVPATYGKPKASFTCPTTIYSGYTMQYTNTSVGTNMSYSWDTNGDGSFGLDETYISLDSISANPGFKFTTSGIKKVCVKVYNCVGADTACKQIIILPLTQKPIADMTVDRSSGFTTDTFRFSDKSLNGPNQWLWTFNPNTIAFVNGTNTSSQNPVVFLNSAQSYTVTLRATNTLGFDTKTIPDMVNVVAYNSPGTQNIIPTGSDIGISRVTLGSIDTTTALQTPVYTAMYNSQKTTLYRGVDYMVTTYRLSNNDAMTTKVWIDYSRNAYFTDAGETIISEVRQNKISTSKTFRIPDNSPTGNTRMRVGVSYDVTTLTPDYAQIGCFEDYGILIGVDNIAPVITLKGPSIFKMEIGKTFADSGATAFDNLEGDISAKVIRTGYVDTSTVGYYTLTYTVSDLYGNVSLPVMRTVQVEVNQTGPKLTLNGQDSVRVEVFNTYVEQGAMATDNTGHDISNQVVRTGDLNTNLLGTYHYTYKVTDAFGFTDTKVRTIIVMDTIKPVISSLSGKDTIRYQINTPYTDQVMVTDNYWGNLIPARTGVINPNVMGYYTLLYNATDGSANQAIPYRLVVKIDDLIPPVLTLNGDKVMTVDVNTIFVDPGVTITDNYYPKNSLTLTITPASFNMNILGINNLQYCGFDPSGNSSCLTRTVSVVDRIAPVLNLIGSDPYHLPRYQKYVDPGVIVTDNYYTDKQLNVITDATKVKNDVPGVYYVTYNVTDPSGNSADAIFRTVIVQDMFLGINTVNGAAQIKIYPNPGNGKFTIDLENGTTIQTVKIYNILGALVKEQSVKSNDKSVAVDISGASEGVYVVEMEGEGKSYIQRINIVK